MEKKSTQIIELVIDKESEEIAIDAISLVTDPAIEVDFVYFNKAKNNLTFAKVDEDKRLLVSPALIPNKQIYRYDPNTDQDYYVYFTQKTVKQASEMYLKHQNNNNATIQHEDKVTGVHTIESWIIENPDMDKSKIYGYNLPKGTWMVSMRIENDAIWQSIKEGELKGLSIEGYFVNKMETLSADFQQYAKVGSMVTDGTELPLFDSKDEAIEYAKEIGCEGYHEHTMDGKTVFMPCDNHDIIKALGEILDEKKKELASYTDYPKGASNNAKRAIKWKEENGTTCGTQVGWTRARQLADRKPITRKTIARMASFKRHQQHKDVPYSEGCGGLMWDAWGGSSGVNWAISKLKEIDGD